jgi:hypothetical protein
VDFPLQGIELLDDDWLYMPSQPWLVYAGASVCHYAMNLCRLHRVCVVAGRQCYAQLAHEQLVCRRWERWKGTIESAV